MRLDEYDLACREFFREAVDAVVAASEPILGRIRRETVEVLPAMVTTVDAGEEVRQAPVQASGRALFTVAGGLAGDFDEVAVAVAQVAEQFTDAVMPNFFAQLSDLTEATGNVVRSDAGLSWESVLEGFEKVQMSFDEDGNPSGLTVTMNPADIERLGEPPDWFLQRREEIIARRRDEWLAGRRVRRLPRPSR